MKKAVIFFLLIASLCTINSCSTYLKNKYQIFYASDDTEIGSLVPIDSTSYQNIYNFISEFAARKDFDEITPERANGIIDLNKMDGRILFAYLKYDSLEYYKMIVFTERKKVTLKSNYDIENYHYYIIFDSYLKNDSNREEHRLLCEEFIEKYQSKYGEDRIRIYKEKKIQTTIPFTKT